MLRLDELLDRAIASFTDRLALEGSGDSLTYGALGSLAQVHANRLQDAGLLPNEPVTVVTHNAPSDVAAFLGVWRAGGVVVPIHPNAARSTWNQLLTTTSARFIISSSVPPEAARPCSDGSWLYCVLGSHRIQPLAITGGALVVFTSGSTGIPKGVVQEHGRYRRKLDAIERTLRPPNALRLLQYLSLTFSFGQWSTLLALTKGGVVSLSKKFKATAFAQDVIAHRWDWVPAVPTMLRCTLADENASRIWEARSPRVGCWVVGGEPMPAELGRDLRNRWPDSGIADVYGLTETNSADFILPAEEYDEHAGSIGVPTPGVCFRIVGDDGLEVVPGIAGEIEVATCYRMLGYLGDEASTVEAMHGDYLRTGDIGFLDESGRVRLLGRKKEQINVAGHEISPLEVEAAYLEHPDILACIAGALSDDITGERVGLLYVTEPGGENWSTQDLTAWGRTRLDGYKVPASFCRVNTLPTGATGKADRKGVSAVFENDVS
ncbi:MAG: class I adenylate-forming enzyme family protein [Pseudomonadota bacterium]